MGIYLSKKKIKTYIFVKLFKQDETKDKIIWKYNLLPKKYTCK
jgi:hypothetical protein